MGEERVVLEDRVHVTVVRRLARHVLAAEEDLAGVGLLEARDHAQGRRLARARGPEHREELAAGDLEVDMVDGDDVAVGLPDADAADVGDGRRFQRCLVLSAQ